MAERGPENSELEKSWLGLMREIATLSDTMKLDSSDWCQADDCTLLQEFDPWIVIRGAEERIRVLEKQLERIRAAFEDCVALRNWDLGFEDWADVAELKEALLIPPPPERKADNG